MRTFGKKKLIKDISANTLQTVITQVFGLAIFYLTSKYLSKEDFGELNWSMAVISTIISIGSLGLDLVFVKRVAAGDNILQTSGIHFFHTLMVAVVLSLFVYCIHFFSSSFTSLHPVFYLVFLNLAIANIANSFKLCLNGLEAYRRLAVLALCTNVFKLLCIIVLFITKQFTISSVLFSYIGTSILEFVLGYFFMSKSISARVKPLLRVYEYKYFILESLPQLGVVLFDSALARIDWILLGILSTAAITAEYSFAYRIFELSKLPLLIISPVLLTRFSKLFAGNAEPDEVRKTELHFFFRLELFLLGLIPIVLISTWSPLIDLITNGKYGKVNEVTYWILAACIPLHGIINFLWTIAFVRGQLKVIMFVTICTSVLNIAGNLLLIPRFNGEGAGTAFLLSTIVQLLLYFSYLRNAAFRPNLLDCIFPLLSGVTALLCSKLLFDNIFVSSLLALAFYFTFALISKQLDVKKIRMILIKREHS